MTKEKPAYTYKKLREENVSFETARSSGPGGQNVNKRNTKVFAYAHLVQMTDLTEEEKTKIKKDNPKKITEKGDLFVWAQDSRSQKINKERAFEKLEMIINKSLAPKTKRIETKVPVSQKKERLHQKKLHSKIKKTRTGWKEGEYI